MITIQYAAGFFDGEGCVNFKVVGQAKTLTVRAIIVNTDLIFLKFFQIRFGGKIYSKSFKNKPNWKPYNSLNWINKEAIEFLRLIKPYVYIKSEQIKLAEEYWEFSQLSKSERCYSAVINCADGRNRGIYIRTDATLAKEQEFKNKMHDLNKKGIALNG